MRELLVVLHREVVERVRSRSFIISTILTPLLILGVGLGPVAFSELQSRGEYRFVVIDETGTGLGAQLGAVLGAPPAEERDERYRVEVTTAPFLSVRDSITALVLSEAVHGYIRLPPDLDTRGEVRVRSEDALPGAVRRRIRAAASTAVQTHRLQRTGLAPAELGRILQPVELDAVQLTTAGEREQSEAGLMFAFLMAFVLYMLILLYGMQVMQSVQEEKTNRIAEVLVSSIRAPHLMLGKVLGVGLAALLQVAVWATLAGALFWQRERLRGLGIPENAVAPLLHGADPVLLAGLLIFMLLGFFLYSTLFAAVGAAADTTEDAQRFTFPLIMPLFLPMVMAEAIISAPADTAAVVLSWVPLTTPLVLPMRMAAGGVGALEALGAVAYLVVWVAAAGWIAGKIYRVGILSTGKRVSWSDLVRWVRMA